MATDLTDEDIRRIASALAEAARAESRTSTQVQKSVVRILVDAGSTVLGEVVASTSPETWNGIWQTIRGFFVAIWEGLAGALEGLVDAIGELFG